MIPFGRPRDLLELRFEAAFRETSETIWHDLRGGIERSQAGQRGLAPVRKEV